MSSHIRSTVLIPILCIFSSCATIIGGSKYYANVSVDDHPKASIYYNDELKGQGYSSFKIPRVDAGDVVFEVKQQGCENQSFVYSGRKIRGWALVSSIVFFTGGSPLPLPYGAAIDFAFGSIYKPDITEKGILRNNYRTYNYILDYTGCGEKRPETSSKEERLIALKSLFQDGLITKKEYEEKKKKILEDF